MKNLTGEESNFHVLKLFLDAVKNGRAITAVPVVEAFIASKKPVDDEIKALTIKARGGDDEAAKELIRKLAEMNDGL